MLTIALELINNSIEFRRKTNSSEEVKDEKSEITFVDGLDIIDKRNLKTTKII